MRRIAIIGICALVVIGVIIGLISYFTTGRIVITTNSPNNTIVLKQISTDTDSSAQKKLFSKQTHGKLDVSVHSGRYVASVQGNSLATTQIIDLRGRQTLRYSLNPINTTGMEPVADEDAHDVAADGSRLVYLNLTDEGVYQVDNQNNITQLTPKLQFKDVRWITTTSGVGENNNGQLYSISNGSVQPLNEPSAVRDSKLVHFAVAATGQIYLSIGSAVYRGTMQGSFSKVYTSTSPFTSLAAQGNTVAIINSPQDGPGSTTPTITVVNGTKMAASKKIEASPTTSWSPNGTYLATTNDGGLTLLDSSLHTLATIPGTNVVGLAWLDSQTMLYSDGSEIWTYSLSSRRANLFANVPLGNTAIELSVSADKQYVYIVVEDSNNNLHIKRVGLRGQTVPGVVYELQDILPETLGGFSLNLLNFAGPPVVTVTPEPDAPPADYLQAAGAQLQQNGFDLSQFQLRLTPIGQGG